MENKKITQEDINRTVWKACDTFRGVIDPSQYKDYILTMLFLKYVSDVYKSKLNDYLVKYEGDRERAERAMRHERFVVPRCGFRTEQQPHRTEIPQPFVQLYCQKTSHKCSLSVFYVLGNQNMDGFALLAERVSEPLVFARYAASRRKIADDGFGPNQGNRIG